MSAPVPSAKLSHQVLDDGVIIVLRPRAGAPISMRVSEGEARRFAWSMLADIDPDAVDDTPRSEAVVSVGDLLIDPSTRQVKVGARRITLSRREFDVLWCIARGRGRVIPDEELLSAVYGAGRRPISNAMDVRLVRLRRKLGEAGSFDLIRRSPGFGYFLHIPDGVAE